MHGFDGKFGWIVVNQDSRAGNCLTVSEWLRDSNETRVSSENTPALDDCPAATEECGGVDDEADAKSLGVVAAQ